MKPIKSLLLLSLPLLLQAQTLKELINIAEESNDLVLSKEFIKASKTKELDAKNSAYFPTVDLGGFYKRDDAISPFQAGDTYSGFAKLSYDIYDGGKKSAQSEQAEFSLDASNFDAEAYKKSLALQITKDFFTIKSLQASLKAREEAQTSLQEQLTRIKGFFEAKMATQDDIDRVQADYDTNIYKMESLKFQILSLKSALSLKVGQDIESLEKSHFNKREDLLYDALDSTKSLIAQNNSIIAGAKSIDSFYYPNIKLEDTYSLYEYGRLDSSLAAMGVLPLDKQNTLLLSVNFRIFDYGAIRNSKEAILLQTKALKSQISFQNKEQKMHYELALARIETAKLRIASAKSALKASTSAFTTIEKKYNAGIVDYVVYLDALTKKTDSKALYESGLNELEIAYAILYYYSGKNIKEELH